MARPFYCPKSTETLNLLQTNFRAASGTVEMLTDLLTDLESLPTLITLSGEPEAGGHGVQEEVMQGVLTLTPRNSVRHELSVWHIGNPRCRQALLWHWGRRSVYVRQKVECSMHSPKDLPCLGQSSKKTNTPIRTNQIWQRPRQAWKPIQAGSWLPVSQQSPWDHPLYTADALVRWRIPKGQLVQILSPGRMAAKLSGHASNLIYSHLSA